MPGFLNLAFLIFLKVKTVGDILKCHKNSLTIDHQAIESRGTNITAILLIYFDQWQKFSPGKRHIADLDFLSISRTMAGIRINHDLMIYLRASHG